MKLSISLDRRDVRVLKARAKRVSGGNISAVITEMIRIAQEWEGREALARWLGAGRGEPSTEVMGGVRADWGGPKRKKRRAKAVSGPIAKRVKHAKKRTNGSTAKKPQTAAQFMAEFRARFKRMPKVKKQRLLRMLDKHSAQWIYT
jgi:hypothetical protein